MYFCSSRVNLGVFFHVPLHNVIEWAKQTHEGISVDRKKSAFIRSDNNVGSSQFIHKKGSFSEVVASGILLDLLRFWSIQLLGGNSSSLTNQVEGVAFFSFLDDCIIFLIFFFFDSISKL